MIVKEKSGKLPVSKQIENFYNIFEQKKLFGRRGDVTKYLSSHRQFLITHCQLLWCAYHRRPNLYSMNCRLFQISIEK